MDSVSVIPKNTEVRRCGLQSSKTADRFIRVRNSLWVGILWHAPDSLNALIFPHKPLHHVHIGSFHGHRDVDHLNAKILRDGKMAVVSGNRAQKLDLIKFTPWGGP